MAIKTMKFDPAKYLKTEEDYAGYLADALETKNASFIADAIGVVAKARGMTQVSRKTGLGRATLYKALSTEGNPGLNTLLAVFDALGLRLSVELPGRVKARAKKPIKKAA